MTGEGIFGFLGNYAGSAGRALQDSRMEELPAY